MPAAAGSPPLVSVIVPVYNAEAFVAAALESILGQTYHPLEVIVADDGSTDRSAEVVRAYGSRVRYLPGAPSGGRPGVPRNRGAAAAAGEILTFFDADDLMAPAKIEAQVSALREHPEAGAVVTNYRNVSDAGEAPQTHFETCPELNRLLQGTAARCVIVAGDVARYLLSRENFVATGTILLRRQVFEEVGGFDETLRIGEDVEFLCRVARRYPVALVRDVGLKRRLHGGNLTREPVRMLEGKIRSREAILRHERSAAVRRRLRRTLAECHAALAEALGGADRKAAMRHLGRGVALYPFSLYHLRVLARIWIRTITGNS